MPRAHFGEPGARFGYVGSQHRPTIKVRKWSRPFGESPNAVGRNCPTSSLYDLPARPRISSYAPRTRIRTVGSTDRASSLRAAKRGAISMGFRRLVIAMLTSGVILAGLVISTSSPATAVTSVKLGKATRAVKGCDVRRTPDSLVIYTRAWGSSTRTNRHGFEAAVVGGKVIRVADRRGNMRIPR